MCCTSFQDAVRAIRAVPWQVYPSTSTSVLLLLLSSTLSRPLLALLPDIRERSTLIPLIGASYVTGALLKCGVARGVLLPPLAASGSPRFLTRPSYSSGPRCAWTVLPSASAFSMSLPRAPPSFLSLDGGSQGGDEGLFAALSAFFYATAAESSKAI